MINLLDRINTHLNSFQQDINDIDQMEDLNWGTNGLLIGNPDPSLLSYLRLHNYTGDSIDYRTFLPESNKNEFHELIKYNFKTNKDFFIYEDPDNGIGLIKTLDAYNNHPLLTKSESGLYIGTDNRCLVFFDTVIFDEKLVELNKFYTLYYNQFVFPDTSCFGCNCEYGNDCNEFKNWLPILTGIEPNNSTLGINFNSNDPQYLKFGVAQDLDYQSSGRHLNITVSDILNLNRVVNLHTYFNNIQHKLNDDSDYDSDQ
jgi:hypothetical protein